MRFVDSITYAIFPSCETDTTVSRTTSNVWLSEKPTGGILAAKIEVPSLVV